MNTWWRNGYNLQHVFLLTGFCNITHRLLCHSLVRSGKPSAVNGRLPAEEQKVQVCDARDDA